MGTSDPLLHGPSAATGRSFAADDDELLDVPWLEKPLTEIRLLSNATYGNKVVLMENTGLPELPARVAVKVIKKASLIQVASHIENPKNELRAALWLQQHPVPGVVQVYGVWQDADAFYLVSEWFGNFDLRSLVENSSLAERMEETKHRIARQILHTVSALHAQGVAHLNLSLDNWLANEDGEVRLIDFAQAVLLPDLGCISHIDRRGICGQASYRSPELLDIAAKRRENVYSPAKVDVFQAGVAIFVLFVGKKPFSEAREMDLERAWLFPAAARDAGRCERLGALLKAPRGRSMPGGCLSLLELLLAPNPDLRPSAAEALQHPWITQNGVEPPRGVDALRLMPGGDTQIVDALRLKLGGTAQIVDALRSAPGGETQIVDALRLRPGGETLIVGAVRSKPGGETQVVDALRSMPGGETQIVDAVRLTPGGETQIVDALHSTPAGEAPLVDELCSPLMAYVRHQVGRIQIVDALRLTRGAEARVVADVRSTPGGETQIVEALGLTVAGKTNIIDAVRVMPGGETQIVDAFRVTPLGKTQIIDAVLFMPGGETQIVDAVRLAPGGETQIVDAVRFMRGGETQIMGALFV